MKKDKTENEIKLHSRIPKKLFKYRNFNENDLNIIRERKLFFPSPIRFNDPFDCSVPIRYDKLTEKEHMMFAFKLLSKLYPKYTKTELLELIKKMKSKGVFRTPDSFQEMMSSQLEHLHDKLGVYSLSATCKNLLMWSHYSTNHTGFCIGFDTLSLYKNTGAGIGEVVYTKNYPEIYFSGQGDISDLIQQIMTKSADWTYEKEYRFTHLEGANTIFDIDPKAIHFVTLGCRITKKNKEEITKIILGDTQLQHVKIYQSEMHTSKYRLVLSRVN